VKSFTPLAERVIVTVWGVVLEAATWGVVLEIASWDCVKGVYW
jgi:hypothetical protein